MKFSFHPTLPSVFLLHADKSTTDSIITTTTTAIVTAVTEKLLLTLWYIQTIVVHGRHVMIRVIVSLFLTFSISFYRNLFENVSSWFSSRSRKHLDGLQHDATESSHFVGLCLELLMSDN